MRVSKATTVTHAPGCVLKEQRQSHRQPEPTPSTARGTARGGRASPTLTGCARGPQNAQDRHTLPEVVRGYPLTFTRSQPHQTRHRPRQAAQGAEYPPIAHHAHRGRTDASQSAERGERHSYPPTAPRRATAAQDAQSMQRDHLPPDTPKSTDRNRASQH